VKPIICGSEYNTYLHLSPKTYMQETVRLGQQVTC